MTSFSDTLTVGLVLVLLFGSIALYLYTRIQQAEQKISLLESILLDLKMSTEVKSYTELPASDQVFAADDFSAGRAIDSTPEHYMPYSDDTPSHDSEELPESLVAPSEEEHHDDTEQYKSVIAEAVKEETSVQASDSSTSTAAIGSNYEAMTLKELQGLAKSRRITGAGSMKRAPIIEALKTSDRSQGISIESGLLGSSSSGSFLDTSAPFTSQESHSA